MRTLCIFAAIRAVISDTPCQEIRVENMCSDVVGGTMNGLYTR